MNWLIELTFSNIPSDNSFLSVCITMSIADIALGAEHLLWNSVSAVEPGYAFLD